MQKKTVKKVEKNAKMNEKKNAEKNRKDFHHRRKKNEKSEEL